VQAHLSRDLPAAPTRSPRNVPRSLAWHAFVLKAKALRSLADLSLPGMV